MSFPRYPEYKESGVEWLGEVPGHWEVCALNYRYEIALGKMLDQKRISGSHLAPYLRNTDVQWGEINTNDLPQMDFEGNDLNRYSLRRGDLLVCEGGEVGRAAIWKAPIEECCYQKALHRLRARNPKRDSAELLYFAFCTATKLDVFSSNGGKSTIAHLPAETLRRYRFPFPPPAEQTAIAAFLDRETAKIDALVAEQRRLIEVLKEKRQAVISHAVTKGLNPDAPMKDSGIEWLGEVPAHWEVLQLKRLVEVGTSITYGIVQAGPDIEGGIPYIRTSDMAGDSFPDAGYMRTTPEIDASYSRSKVKPNDLVVAIRASIGKGLLVPDFLEGANLTQGTARISPSKTLMPRFLLWSFNSEYCQTSIRNVAKGTTFLEITLDALRRVPLAVPPVPEQAEIVERLDDEVAQFDMLKAEAQRAIDLLHERRTALISAAVTGQIDVREQDGLSVNELENTNVEAIGRTLC